MDERIRQEIDLLKKEYPDLEFKEEVLWVLIPNFPLPSEVWSKNSASVCFQIPPGYPGNPPYGFYVHEGLRLKGSNEKPENYEEPAQTPFENTWGKLSWAHDNSWRATADISSGGNLLNFVRTFQVRLKEGK